MKIKMPCELAVTLCLVGAVFTVFGVGETAAPGTTNTYEGKVAFWSEEQYTEFKKIVAPNQVQIHDLDVWSSDFPIIVQFEIEAEKGYKFPYGTKVKDYDLRWMLPVGIAMLVPGIVVLWKYDEEAQNDRG